MPMIADVWAQAQFDATPNTDKLDAAEKKKLLDGLKAHYDASITFLKANMTVMPTALITPPGATVVTAGSPSAQTGATTSPVAVTGTGTVT